jgi:quinol monooxygenase YgiN
MLAHSVTVHAQPHDLDDLITHFREAMLPILRRQPGYRGTTLLADRTVGTLLAIMLFETASDMAAFEASADHDAYKAAIARVAPRVTAPPQVMTYEVAFQD